MNSQPSFCAAFLNLTWMEYVGGAEEKQTARGDVALNDIVKNKKIKIIIISILAYNKQFSLWIKRQLIEPYHR